MPGYGDENYDPDAPLDDSFETDSGDGAGEEAPPTDRRALLQSLAEADPDSDLSKLAALALESLTEREQKAAEAESLLAVANELTESSFAEAMAELDRQKALGLDADEDALRSAVDTVESMRAAMRAAVEAERAAGLQQQLDAVYQQAVDSGYPEDFAQAAVEEFARDYQAILGPEMATEADLLNDHPIFRDYEMTQWAASREQQVLRDMQAERLDHYERMAADAQAEQDAFVDGRLAVSDV